MLCSGGPNSNWLDRLRSNKGFPIGDELGLDHFLTHQDLPNPNPNPDPDSSQSQSHSHSHSHSEDGDGDGNPNSASSYLVITGILSDLFNVAPPSKCSSKKFPRKQPNPKLYADHNKQQHLPTSNSHNTSTYPKGELQEQEAEDDDKPDKQLVGYSKTEVTVIDTSSDVWNSDKLIFRRNNVWKVKDKKAKSRTYGRKKRNLHSPQNTHLIPDTTASAINKTKLWPSQERFHFTAQQLRGDQSPKPFNKGYTPQYCFGPEISANAPDSGNDKKENAYTVSPENGSYDTERSDLPRI